MKSIKSIIKDMIEVAKQEESAPFEFNGHKYSISYYKGKVCFWVQNGFTNLESDIPLENALDVLSETMSNYEKGYIKCAECGKLVSLEEVEYHRYYAALFCNDCWNNKWKAIRAKDRCD